LIVAQATNNPDGPAGGVVLFGQLARTAKRVTFAALRPAEWVAGVLE